MGVFYPGAALMVNPDFGNLPEAQHVVNEFVEVSDESISRFCQMNESIDWFKANITGTSHISRGNLRFPVDFPLSQPIQ